MSPKIAEVLFSIISQHWMLPFPALIQIPHKDDPYARKHFLERADLQVQPLRVVTVPAAIGRDYCNHA